jgi:acyl carrier protein
LKVIEEVKGVLGQILRLGDKVQHFDVATPLFGSIPELDSLAVVNVILALEDRFGIVVEDDEVTADVFETIGSLSSFIEGKLAT